MRQIGTKNLTYTQRLQIETLNNARHSKKEIAAAIGVSLTTIYNELKRGECELLDGETWITYKSYSAYIAQERYRLKCTAKGAPLKIGRDYAFCAYLEKRVNEDKISPCAVLGEIKRKGLPFTNISKTTLYRYIEIGIFANITIDKRKPKGYRKTVIKRAPRGVSIEKRPEEIGRRRTFGHWEMDCVCGPTKNVFLVLSERLSRKEIIFPMKNQKAESVISCLNILERRYGKLFRKVFKSITVDNGSEFYDHPGIERSIYRGKRTSVYYCHPYCSSERGTNERLNREIRRLVPKGTDLSRFTAEDVQQIEDWVNSYPREVLGFATSSEVFNQYVNQIA